MRFFDLLLVVLYAAFAFLIIRYEGFQVAPDMWLVLAAVVALVAFIGAFILDQLAYKKRQK
jgi:hypothetical protein